MEAQVKETYEAPSTQVLEIKTEGIICGSGLNDYNRQIPEDWY